MNKTILCTLVLVIGAPPFAHADKSTAATDDTSQSATASASPPVIATPTVKFYGLFDVGSTTRGLATTSISSNYLGCGIALRLRNPMTLPLLVSLAIIRASKSALPCP